MRGNKLRFSESKSVSFDLLNGLSVSLFCCLMVQSMALAMLGGCLHFKGHLPNTANIIHHCIKLKACNKCQSDIDPVGGGISFSEKRDLLMAALIFDPGDAQTRDPLSKSPRRLVRQFALAICIYK